MPVLYILLFCALVSTAFGRIVFVDGCYEDWSRCTPGTSLLKRDYSGKIATSGCSGENCVDSPSKWCPFLLPNNKCVCF